MYTWHPNITLLANVTLINLIWKIWTAKKFKLWIMIYEWWTPSFLDYDNGGCTKLPIPV